MTLRTDDRTGSWQSVVARNWVRLYTAGLSQEVRAKRIRQIDSDVWEQLAVGSGTGSIVGRALRGIPADLLWRLEVGGLTRPVNWSQVGLAAILFMALGGLTAAFSGLDFRSDQQDRGRVVQLGSIEAFASVPWCSEHYHFCVSHSESGRLIALYSYDTNDRARKDGCTVRWLPEHTIPASNRQIEVTGAFRSDCTGSTYDLHGRLLLGPAPRDLDKFQLTLSSDEEMAVDTRILLCGARGGAMTSDCPRAPR